MPVDQFVSHPLRLRADGGTAKKQEPSPFLSNHHIEKEKEKEKEKEELWCISDTLGEK